MGRQTVMGVYTDPVVSLSALAIGIDVDRHAAEMRQVVEQLVTYLPRDLVPFRDREAARHGDAELGVQAVTDPAGAHVRDPFDARNVTGGVADLVQRLGLHAAEDAKQDGSGRLPDEREDRHRDQDADHRVGEQVARPHAHRSDEHREARPAVYAGVVAVGDERGTADLLPDPDVEFARIPEMNSTRNIATLIQRTTWSTRRWRSGTSALTSQQSFTRSVYREGPAPDIIRS